jgi:hypothetical protein
VTSLSVAGFVLGGVVLAVFPRSMRSTLLNAKLGVAQPIQKSMVEHSEELSEEFAETNSLFPRGALKKLGGYTHESVEEIEGCYVCFRPMFSNPSIINAYQITLLWDSKRACLTFEEQNRSDSIHTQKGSVFIPDGKPFMSPVTI